MTRRRTPTPAMTVVIATYNRPDGLRALLDDLEQQQDAPTFAVIVVDDGSREQASSVCDSRTWTFALSCIRQDNAGPAAARDRGIEAAKDGIIVLLDDDMRVGPDFLSEHGRAHAAGNDVVLGNITTAPAAGRRALHERFHAAQLERFLDAVQRGDRVVRGIHLCTGNVSFTKQAYRRAGGFDRTLLRSEDRDLGVRFESAGFRLGLWPAAKSLHESDHADLDVWLRRARDYGVFDLRIAQRHPGVDLADPWRFWLLVNPVTRALALAIVVRPDLGGELAHLAMRAGAAFDARGREREAMAATVFAYGAQYFRGLREEAGSITAALDGLLAYVSRRGVELPSGWTAPAASIRFARAVLADHGSVRRYRGKYHGERVARWRLPLDVVSKVGLQMLVGVRLMQLTRDLGIPMAPRALSRLIRHLYGAEIHWDAEIAPGISIVHGVGLVISHAARVEAGCILFHNVTLGEGIDPTTRDVGAPTLASDVHVGPGSTLLGPIHVGAQTKVMAGSVLSSSVAPRSLVRPADVVVEARATAGAHDSESAS